MNSASNIITPRVETKAVTKARGLFTANGWQEDWSGAVTKGGLRVTFSGSSAHLWVRVQDNWVRLLSADTDQIAEAIQ